MPARLHHFIRHARSHAWFAGLMALTAAILVFEAPQGAEEADALSVRPYAQVPQGAETQPARSAARGEPADKLISQRPTIRT